MKFFESKVYASELEDRIKTHVLRVQNIPILVIIQIGESRESEKYILLKEAFCNSIGIKTEIIKLPEDLEDFKIFSAATKTFNRKDVGSVIVQLPLPRKSLMSVLDSIPYKKDIDLLSAESQNRFYSGNFSKLSPIIRSLKLFVEKSSLDLKNKKAVVIGGGFLVGKPAAFYLEHLEATVTVIDNYLTGTYIDADVLILSAGIANLVNGEDTKKGCSVIDFGSSVRNGKAVGDLNLKSEISDLGVLSPSPGGIGPLVVRFLVMNHLGI